MPLPEDARTVFLGGLFVLACLAAMYVASDILLPVVLAIMLKLLLQPLVRVLEDVRIPRVLGAALAILLLIGMVAGIGTAVTRPAAAWIAKLPEVLPRVERELRPLGQPLHAVQRAMSELEHLTAGPPTPAPPPPHAAMSASPRSGPPAQAQPQPAPAAAAGAMPLHTTALVQALFSGTSQAIAGFFTTLLVLFYLLVSGETFLRRLVEILPRFADKRRAVEISLHVERDISAYLLTITLINGIVGLATGCVMWLCGVGDPLLWGVTAFLLNYIPILGPLSGVVLFAIVGVLSKGALMPGLLPAGLYLVIHLIEGETVTPMILARRFTVNPVAVVLGLVFWYWMWGVPGAVLSVPMLAIMKIVCDDVPPLRAFGHFLEG
ncbi:MAG: AI-2E family transporter [Alphaproteobacteria bacterium]|nr:AI-2E family transporter [Alphaproteobacteria bacterium]